MAANAGNRARGPALAWAWPRPSLGLAWAEAATGRLSAEDVAGYRECVIALLLAAVAVGLSNLAASIGIGVTGVTAKTRLQVSLVFGVFESGMPIVGLLIGQRIASDLGQAVRWPGAILLMVVGAFGLVRSLRDSRKSATGESPQPAAVPATPVVPATAFAAATPVVPAVPPSRLGRLLISGFVLSLDNLVVGFALGTYQVDILTGAILIGAVSVAMSLAGLELGGLLGRWAGQRSEQMSGLILILVGAAIAGGALS
jgi:putative Mn2+ efflux pump MntP